MSDAIPFLAERIGIRAQEVGALKDDNRELRDLLAEVVGERIPHHDWKCISDILPERLRRKVDDAINKDVQPSQTEVPHA